MKPNAIQTQILRALRAADMTPGQLRDRIGGYYANYMAPLVRAGLVSCTGDHWGHRYALTPAGRRACPPRNAASVRGPGVAVPSACILGVSRQPGAQVRMVTVGIES